MSYNKDKKEHIFSTTDPFNRKVYLKSSTWRYHITGGHNYRKELIGQEEIVKDVISDPKFILPNDPDNLSGTREKFIDLVMLPTMSSLKGLVVVVDYENEEYGDVVTVITKSSPTESTTGGAYYVRPKSPRNNES